MLSHHGPSLLRVAVLASHRAPGLEQLLADPQRGTLFEIAYVVTSEPEFAQRALVEAAGIPLVTHPFRAFLAERGAKFRDTPVRREYDAATAEILRRAGVDTVMLLGYLYVLTGAMLEAFAGRVLNVHDSDLTIRDAQGEPRYVGLRSTRDAILAGERETRSTIHFVTEKLDGGPVFLRSRAYAVAPFVQRAVDERAYDIVKAYAYAQREWMMRDCWAELVVEALEHLDAGIAPVDVIDWLAIGSECSTGEEDAPAAAVAAGYVP